MDAVERKNDVLKVALGAAVFVTVGVFVLSVAAQLPSAPLSQAFAQVASVEPVEPPDCASLAPSGQKWHGVDIIFEGDRPASSSVGSATLSADPSSGPASGIEWHADLGVDAVVIHAEDRGSPHPFRVHHFEQERFDGRHHRLGAATPQKISLCYDLELTVNKDTNPKLTRVYDWNIDETVEPAHWQLTPGDAGVSTYRISVTRDGGTEKGWQVAGTITVDNLTPHDATIESIEDRTDDDIRSQIDCGVSVPGYVLPSGKSLNCEYRTELPDAKARQATVEVRTSGQVQGASATSRIDFAQAEVREVGKSVYVTNNQGRTWTFHRSGSSVYERTFRCEADAGIHPSAVRIDGTDKRSSSAVSVDCRTGAGETTASRPDDR